MSVTQESCEWNRDVRSEGYFKITLTILILAMHHTLAMIINKLRSENLNYCLVIVCPRKNKW